MKRFREARTIAALGLVVLGAAACAPMGGLGDVLGGVGGRSLYGEVRSVDRGRIQLREQYGRDYTVRYDNRTRVLYGRQQYPVSALERGDVVQVQVQYDRNNTAWAERIEVRESARDRDRDRGGIWGSTRVQRIDGRVDRIDGRRGWFSIEQGRSSLIVYLPRDARREDIRRFDRLRRGDRVRADIRIVGRDQAELVRFR